MSRCPLQRSPCPSPAHHHPSPVAFHVAACAADCTMITRACGVQSKQRDVSALRFQMDCLRGDVEEYKSQVEEAAELVRATHATHAIPPPHALPASRHDPPPSHTHLITERGATARARRRATGGGYGHAGTERAGGGASKPCARSVRPHVHAQLPARTTRRVSARVTDPSTRGCLLRRSTLVHRCKPSSMRTGSYSTGLRRRSKPSRASPRARRGHLALNSAPQGRALSAGTRRLEAKVARVVRAMQVQAQAQARACKAAS